MVAAVTVVLAGVGLFALGFIEPEMYAIGIVVALVGSIGIAVRSWDLVLWWRHAWQRLAHR